jgi:hypothetical protein
MANDFSTDTSCKALWRFENGALLADSIGGNTLTASASSPVADTVDFLEGAACADFEYDNSQYFYIADASLDAGFPLKNGDTKKIIAICSKFKMERVDITTWIWSKYNSTTDMRVFGIYISSAGKLGFYCGYNAGATGELITADYVLTAGRWYSLGIWCDGVRKELYVRIYDHSTSAVVYSGFLPFTNVLNVEASAVCIGAKADPTNYFDGRIDEVVVFDRILLCRETQDHEPSIAHSMDGE